MDNDWLAISPFDAHRTLFEINYHGPEALAFAASCETKDYSLRWEELIADRAEYKRLTDKHRASRAAGE